MRRKQINFQVPISTPVLLMVFNRPDKTQKIFDVIKEVKPKKLYVAADGPRENVINDKQACDNVRNIVTNIDWECDSKFLFHEKNIGCSKAGATAWDWLFSHEDKMIFLEDDGIPSKSFFWFCQELLQKYEDNPKIGYVYGMNFGMTSGNGTYFFTRYNGGAWGMATWKRVHELYEYNLSSFKETKNLPSFKRSFIYNFEYKRYVRGLNRYLKRGGVYDLPITYTVYKYHLLNIMPNVNMVTDIGWGNDATFNTLSPNSKLAQKYGNLPRYELEEIVHPPKIERNIEFEKKFLLHRVFQDKTKSQAFFEVYFRLVAKILNKIRKLVNAKK